MRVTSVKMKQTLLKKQSNFQLILESKITKGFSVPL